MNYRIIGSLVFYIFHCCVLAEENQLPYLYQTLLPSVVTLHTFENEIIQKQVHVVKSPNGLGSGVIISKEGLIVTAAHVVQAIDGLHIEFSNGERRIGKVFSSLPWADLALVKVDNMPKEVAIAVLGDSNKTLVGERAFVIGAPLGLNRTLTVGYISGRHSKGSSPFAPLSEFFQTDAAINPGNSGGPLFNMNGEVIGISSYIKSQTGGSVGLGFTVTSESVKQLILDRAYFWSGMDVYPLTTELSQAFQLPEKVGVLVQKVAKDSPAQKAGIKGGTIYAVIDDIPMMLGGDIILSVNGVSFNGDSDINNVIQSTAEIKSRDRLVLSIWRQGKRKEITLKASQ